MTGCFPTHTISAMCVVYDERVQTFRKPYFSVHFRPRKFFGFGQCLKCLKNPFKTLNYKLLPKLKRMSENAQT